jgi:hypothetical protein
MPERHLLCALPHEMLQVRKEKSQLQRLHLETLSKIVMLSGPIAPTLSCVQRTIKGQDHAAVAVLVGC